MKSVRWRATLGAAIALPFVLVALTAVQAALSKGEKSPDFKLTSIDGTALSFADIRKDPARKGATRVVLLDFWATWCPACRDEIPHLQKLHVKYEKRGLAVVGIALDRGGIKDVKPFAANRKLTYTLLLDPKGAVKRKYGVRLIPATFIIDRQGIVRSVHIGFVPGMEKALEAEVKSLLK